MRKSIFTILVFSSTLAVYAQVNVRAVLQDTTGCPIEFASVYNSTTQQGVITNEEGLFELNAQPSDVIVIRSLGYKELQSAAEQLQDVDVLILKEAPYSISEVTVTPSSNDAKSIVKKFKRKIWRNYPMRPSKLSGVYKEYALTENDFSSFFQCDVDILVQSIGTRNKPIFKTKVHDFKSFRNSEKNNTGFFIVPEYHFRKFCIHNFRFFWDFKRYQHRLIGYIEYKGSTLARINFMPLRIDKSVKQVTGSMYIDMKTFALVFLQYEMIPNEIDYTHNNGILQKTIVEENKIMFEFKRDYYYPSYVISKMTGSLGFSIDNEIQNKEDTIKSDIIFNFFSKNVKYNPSDFIADDFSIIQLKYYNVIDSIDRLDYKSNFILETEQERLLFQR